MVYRIRKVYTCRVTCDVLAHLSRPDVRITYTALDADSSGRSRMDDLVEYRKRSAGKDTAPSTGTLDSSAQNVS
jgi:hypothetical protein